MIFYVFAFVFFNYGLCFDPFTSRPEYPTRSSDKKILHQQFPRREALKKYITDWNKVNKEIRIKVASTRQKAFLIILPKSIISLNFMNRILFSAVLKFAVFHRISWISNWDLNVLSLDIFLALAIFDEEMNNQEVCLQRLLTQKFPSME